MLQMMKDQTLQSSLLPSSSRIHGEYTKTNCSLYIHPQIILHQQIYYPASALNIKDLFMLFRYTEVIYASWRRCSLLYSHLFCATFRLILS